MMSNNLEKIQDLTMAKTSKVNKKENCEYKNINRWFNDFTANRVNIFGGTFMVREDKDYWIA